MASNTLSDRPGGISLIGGGLVGVAYLILAVPFVYDIDLLLKTPPIKFIEYVAMALCCFVFGIGLLKGSNWLRILFWLALISLSLKIYFDSRNVVLIVISIIASIVLFTDSSNTFFRSKGNSSGRKTENRINNSSERIAEIDAY